MASHIRSWYRDGDTVVRSVGPNKQVVQSAHTLLPPGKVSYWAAQTTPNPTQHITIYALARTLVSITLASCV